MHRSSLRFSLSLSLSLNFSLLFFCGASFFSSAMTGLAALEALTEKLYDFIQSMEDDVCFFVFLVHFYVFLIVIMFINYLLCLQGIVDHHFKDCYNLKEANGPFLFIELLPTYISDSETTLEEMTTELYG
jgi:histidine-containing phosphotransfer protein